LWVKCATSAECYETDISAVLVVMSAKGAPLIRDTWIRDVLFTGDNEDDGFDYDYGYGFWYSFRLERVLLG
jgi:hypothetical protein